MLPDAETLRTRLARAWDFRWPPEWPLHEEQEPAAVLIAIETSAMRILLTRRTDHLYNHPGQISLPGGRLEAHDGNLQDAALREAEEEIGLPRSAVEVIGSLPDYATSSGFRVAPIVGLIHQPFEAHLDTFEVAELIHLPLAFMLETANWQKHRVQRGDMHRSFHALPWQGRFIWGATAGMLAMFAACLAES